MLLEQDDERTRSSSLCLDLEAASHYREKLDSPDSTSNTVSVDRLAIFRETVSDSSSSNGFGMDSLEPHLERHVMCSDIDHSRDFRRRQTSFAKHKRMSLMASAMNPTSSLLNNRKSLFIRPPRASILPRQPILLEELAAAPAFRPPEEIGVIDEMEIQESGNLFDNDQILQTVLGFLHEPELLCVASLVCSKWADAATHAHARLMLLSVGCGESQEELDDDESVEEEVNTSDAVPGLMERPWKYLTTNFPWACFLSEGAFKRVYKVFNHTHRVEEAISVM
jgi:hypothetical protein